MGAAAPGAARRPASHGRGDRAMTTTRPPAGQPAIRPQPRGAAAATGVGGAVLLVGTRIGLWLGVQCWWPACWSSPARRPPASRSTPRPRGGWSTARSSTSAPWASSAGCSGATAAPTAACSGRRRQPTPWAGGCCRSWRPGGSSTAARRSPWPSALSDEPAHASMATMARQVNRTTGETMSESSDSRHQQHSYPVHGTSDDRDGARDAARRWVRRKRIFSTIVGIYLLLSLMWFVIDMLDDSTSLWFYWPMLGTGLGVVVTGIVMFGL